MKFIFRIIPVIFLLGGCLHAQIPVVTLRGINPEYSEQEIEIFRYREQFFNTREILGKCKVGSSGEFTFQFPLGSTTAVYCQTPVYLGVLYAEPGKSYHINLPPLPEQEDSNADNPYYYSPLWHMIPEEDKIPGTSRLNASIRNYDTEFEPFLNKQMLRYYDPKMSREKLDSFIVASGNIKPEGENIYFAHYSFYKTAILEISVSQFNNHSLFDTYLKDRPLYPEIPAWWDFIGLYFDKYLNSLYSKDRFRQVYKILSEGNYHRLDSLLRYDIALHNDTLREWIILKEAYRSFYEENIPVQAVQAICESVSLLSENDISILLAGRIKSEVQRLLPGTVPPSGMIVDIEGNRKDITAFSGKYIYLGFCSLNNLECLREFEYLKYYYSKHSNYLDILIILPETEKNLISSFTYENSIPWKFWYCEDCNTLENNYKVKAYPVFYLLKPDGKLLLSPAMMPSGNFEKEFFNILKAAGEI